MKVLPINDKYTMTIEEASAYTSIGINKLYDMTNDPRCPFVMYVGKRRLIKRKALEKYLDNVIEI